MALRPLFLLVFGAFAAVDLAAAEGGTPDKLNSLLNNSPFGSSKAGGQVVGTGADQPLEFRAVLEEGGNKLYSIYDPATHRSTWVGLNDPANGFSVKTYDAGHENITVDYQGKTLTLAIKRAPAVAQAPIQTMPSAVPYSGPIPSNGGVVGPGPASPMDQQRLIQIQEEIRRRRALRNQASGVANPPGGQVQTNTLAQPAYPSSGPVPLPGLGNSTGPQYTPSSGTGPQFTPSTGTGPQPIPPKQ
jgi:hypothetical protein